MSSILHKILTQSADIEKIHDRLEREGKVNIARLPRPLQAALASWLAKEQSRPALLIVPEDEFNVIMADVETAAGERALPFPAWDILPYEHKYPAAEKVATRIYTLSKFLELKAPVVVTTPSALMWQTLPPDVIRRHTFEINKNDHIPPEELIERLISAGYRREQMVEFLGAVARRGDIVDFFSPAQSDPVRVEFFGDVVDEIRLFSTRNQTSLRKVQRAKVLPAIEWLPMSEGSVSELLSRVNEKARELISEAELEEIAARIALDRHFPGEIWFSPLFEPAMVFPMDFFSTSKPIIVCVEPERLHSEFKAFIAKANELYQRVSWEDLKPLPPKLLFDHSLPKTLDRAFVELREIPSSPDDIDFDAKLISIPTGKVAILSRMEELSRKGDVVVAAASKAQAERISSKIGGSIPVPVKYGTVTQSFTVKKSDGGYFSVISGDEVLGFSRTMFVPSRYHQGRAMLAHYGLEQGDLVVHSDYGIARFMGIKTLNLNGRRAEFLLLLFADEEKLYVPMEDFFKVSPYVGPRGIAKLSKLGGRKWTNAKLRAKKRAFELAGELVRIYALREVKTRPPFPRNPEWEQILEQTFPYEETPDQRKSIEDVMADLSSNKPMDRLICGDVGFGKTEIAIRAALRVAAAGYQVAVLVPTTVLAAQHYETFTKRLEPFPVKIEMLSRFTTGAKAKRIIDELAEGKIDIIIGTHALLSERVRFRQLGLVIIDEEQWFGVRHKEKLRSLRAEVDVLTLTATPIPRTLYLSLSGVKNISLVDTPPKMRRPIFTQVINWNVNLFSKIIYNELDRGGQVFFVHNRVETIGGIEVILKSAMPDVRIAVAHGQMPERQLEKTILDFRSGKYDLLLSTAIIESGTDMPRVNTIIINRADQFGLAQLYQLRGRVGRSDVQAYAYLVLPPYRSLTPSARKRIRALLEYTELGSGYALATKDLEIRGAGNILGKEQSGFIADVGLHLYSKLLAEAVAELKGQKPPILEPIPFSIDFDAYIPSDYIADTEERLWIYQKVFTAHRVERIDELEREIRDRFGRIPEPTCHLFGFLKARILATRAGFSAVKFNPKWITLSFDPNRLPLIEIDRKIGEDKTTIQLELTPNPVLKIPRFPSVDEDLKFLIRILGKLSD